jgi:hypothetical protein
MSKDNAIFLGTLEAQFEVQKVSGKVVQFEGEDYYKISNSHQMRPFFMSVVSASNHWMFLSSNGGLSAGRKDSNNALFPYYTDDKITESAETTGSKTIFQCKINNKTYLWEPFSNRYQGIYNCSRNLYKNNLGNKVIFEEINHDLGLCFKYQWQTSDAFGFVKKATISNLDEVSKTITVLDGLQNIMPYGVSADLQNSTSNLVDAYKKSELDASSGLGIFALSAIIVDKAEPSEALKATIVWSLGLDNPSYLLSSLQLDKFRRGEAIQQEEDIKAEKGAYFVKANFTLAPKSEKQWFTIAEVNQSIIDITSISYKIKNQKNLVDLILADVNLGSKQLKSLVSASDGLQLTADTLQNTRHFSNTMFNIMRGGIFDTNYQMEKGDFIKHITSANTNLAKEKFEFLNNLPNNFSLNTLKEILKEEDNPHLIRLALEYLPLKFSRRHGDPSRPWNKFSINTKSEIDGSKILDYEGNWRDIFQNWEALAHSYPKFIEGMIFKFLNATTFDGYNPYRVTKDGFDWEVIEPDNPWSYIGYWGDHQIIYLQKFLEFIESHYPQKLADYFSQDIFVYANVPYRIKSYQDILKNPKDTIEFDTPLHNAITANKEVLGADAALISVNNSIYNVNLIEKLLATLLAKLSNFIPEGGIWMNTQRPEWNDANNALVGNGVSMVTLSYLRRFVYFVEETISKTTETDFKISEELTVFFKGIFETLNVNKSILKSNISDTDRKIILDGLATAGSNYRNQIYNQGFSGQKQTITKQDLLDLLNTTKSYINQSIEANKRADNLYHAYNLITIKEDAVSIAHLPEMLEGQVAVLSSKYLSAEASLDLLNALKSSALFRPNQYSYILYPNKTLPRFNKKNIIPSEKVNKSALLKQLLAAGNKQILKKDIIGNYHFNGNFNNVGSLKVALSELDSSYDDLVAKESNSLFELFESVFNHKAFTGRSGTFYGYEGLGSIYWHMVSKLLLSVQEVCLRAIENNENPVVIGKLLDHYYEINEGLGVHKSPELYGAFPTDPYSHTPEGKGAQQPGMTGQVKEDILSRFGELGVSVVNGQVVFNPCLLRKAEFLKGSKLFSYNDLNNNSKQIKLEKGTLAFTHCQVPIVYSLSDKEKIIITFSNGLKKEVDNLKLDLETSHLLFNRSGEIDNLHLFIKK